MQVWKTVWVSGKVEEMKRENEIMGMENERVAREIGEMKARYEEMRRSRENYKYFKLQRCLNKTLRRIKNKTLRKWNIFATNLQNKHHGFKKVAKLFKNHSLRININKWKIKTKEQRRLQYISNFLENNERCKIIAKKAKIYDAWDRFKNTQKHIRGNLRRSLIHCDRNLEYRAFK